MGYTRKRRSRRIRGGRKRRTKRRTQLRRKRRTRRRTRRGGDDDGRKALPPVWDFSDDPLPAGWNKVPSHSEAGKLVYENVHTGKHINWRPVKEDGSGANEGESLHPKPAAAEAAKSPATFLTWQDSPSRNPSPPPPPVARPVAERNPLAATWRGISRRCKEHGDEMRQTAIRKALGDRRANTDVINKESRDPLVNWTRERAVRAQMNLHVYPEGSETGHNSVVNKVFHPLSWDDVAKNAEGTDKVEAEHHAALWRRRPLRVTKGQALGTEPWLDTTAVDSFNKEADKRWPSLSAESKEGKTLPVWKAAQLEKVRQEKGQQWLKVLEHMADLDRDDSICVCLQEEMHGAGEAKANQLKLFREQEGPVSAARCKEIKNLKGFGSLQRK